MKQKIQAIACAAMIAVGGSNAYMAIGGGGISGSELQIDGVEVLAQGEDFGKKTKWEYFKYVDKDGYGYEKKWCEYSRDVDHKCIAGSYDYVYHPCSLERYIQFLCSN